MKVISMFRKEGIVPVTIAATIAFFLVVSIVQATTTISTDITTGGALSVGTTATLTGAVAAGSTLSVTGATTLANASTTQISASGISWLNGNVNFGGFATTTALTGAFATRGAIAASSTLQVTGNQTNYGTLTVSGTGATTLGGTLTVTGITSLLANASTTQISASEVAWLNGNVNFGGFATTTALTGAFATRGAIAASSTLQVTGNQTNYGTLTVSGTGATTLGGALTVTGNTSLQQASSTNQTLSGNLWVNGNATTSSAGAISTQSTLGVTGLSTLTGGYISASSTVVGALTVTGTFSPTQTSATSFTVSGLTTLGQASTTIFSSYGPAYFGGSATSSFSSNGALNVVGLATFGNASSTILSSYSAYFGGAGTTTITSAGDVNFGGFATTTALTGAFATRGAIAASSTLQVTGDQTNYGALTVSGVGVTTLGGALTVTGQSTLAGATFSGLASSTTLKVGNDAVSTINGLIRGFCTIADISIAIASTTVQASCTGATGVTTSYAVFVQATSSMPGQIVIQSATSTTDAINVRLLNTGITNGTPGAAAVSLNFWAVR